MSGFAIFLVIVSTFFHAGWNVLTRKARSERTFLMRALIVTAVLGLIPAAYGYWKYWQWPIWENKVWICACATGVFSGVYFFALAQAYSSGEFTVVYPVARALPVLLVGVGDIIRGGKPTALGWLGMTLVAFACLVVPLQSFRTIRARSYFNRNTVWVAVAALCTTGYSITDKIALDAIRPSGPFSSVRYCYLFYALSAVVYFICVKIFGRGDEDPGTVGWKRPAIAGVLTFSSYWIILWVYSLIGPESPAAYVVAFRQFSILIGVVMGIFIFRERGALLRLAAACLMVVGLLLIGLFGRCRTTTDPPAPPARSPHSDAGSSAVRPAAVKQVNGVSHHRRDDVKTLHCSFGASGEVDDEAFLSDTSLGAAQHRMRRHCQALRTHGFGEARDTSVEHGKGRFRCHIPLGHARAAGR